MIIGAVKEVLYIRGWKFLYSYFNINFPNCVNFSMCACVHRTLLNIY